MRKISAVLFIGLLMTTTAARAEHKLLITEVLDARQVEAQATFEYAHLQMTKTDAGDRIRVTGNTTESLYSLGLGLGHGLEVTASLPYVFSEQLKEQSAAVLNYEKRDGFGDFSFGGKYSILEEKHAPLSLVAGLDIKFDTAGGRNAGTGTTDVSPYIAASKKFGHHATPYAIYRATISNHGNADTHTLSLGDELELNETVTFDVRLDAAFATATGTVSSMSTYDLEVASYLQLFHNFYLIPSVAVATGSTAHSKVADIQTGSPFGIKGAISLYYLY